MSTDTDAIPALCEHATPGSANGFWVYDADGTVLGVLCHACGADDQIAAAVLAKAQAERRLLDAAPALLEACRDAAAFLDAWAVTVDDPGSHAILLRASLRAAIAQATGADADACVICGKPRDSQHLDQCNDCRVRIAAE